MAAQSRTDPDWLIKSEAKCRAEKSKNDDVKLEWPAEECNDYCEWLRHEFEMPAEEYEGDDAKLSLGRLGDKYRNIFGKIKLVLIDLSGTLHVGKEYICGGLEAVELLREFGIPYRYVTNTTKEPKSALLAKLTEFGFSVEPDEVITSLTVARKFIDKHDLRPLFLLEKEAMEDFEGVKQDNLNSVCVGLSPTNFNYEMMNQAMRIVHRGAPWIGIHKGRYQEDSNGQLSLGPGPFIQSLEFASDTLATIVGKPEFRFFADIINSVGCSLTETVMIGDDVRDDVGGPVKYGMKGILVRTGKFRNGDEKKILPLKPSLIALDFLTAVRAVVGAVSAERELETGETSDEDNYGNVKTKRSHRVSRTTVNREFLERIQAHVNLNECPTPAAWCPSKLNPKVDVVPDSAPKKSIAVKDLMVAMDESRRVPSKALFFGGK